MSTTHHTPYQNGVTEFKATHMNAPLGQLDAAITALSQIVVIDRDLTAPPGSPISGDTYIPAATATGDWAGYEDYIAYYNGEDWILVEPQEGWAAWVIDEGIGCIYGGDSNGWEEDTPTPGDHTHTEADITDLDKYTQAEVDALLADPPYDIGGTFNGTPTDGLILLRYPMPRAVTFPASLTASKMVAGTAATASTVFSLKKNSTEFGTATFAASGTSATFAAASETSFAAGDILTIVSPATADSTLADLGWAIVGSR